MWTKHRRWIRNREPGACACARHRQLAVRAKIAKTGVMHAGKMQVFTAKEAKDGFGRLVDVARMEPVLVSKHGRPVVVMMAVEWFDRLNQIATKRQLSKPEDRDRDAWHP
jgi:prevent-host-death family protein